MYVGYGIKGGAETYYPVNPPMIVEDPSDPAEQHEPNPKDAPTEPVVDVPGSDGEPAD